MSNSWVFMIPWDIKCFSSTEVQCAACIDHAPLLKSGIIVDLRYLSRLGASKVDGLTVYMYAYILFGQPNFRAPMPHIPICSTLE
jgi:hypothetical protein